MQQPGDTTDLIKTTNVQGTPGAWRALSTWSNTVLLLQDTPFSHKEFKSFFQTCQITKLQDLSC